MKAGLTQEQAAEQIPCGVRTLQRYEKGTRFPNLQQLRRMQACYNCEIADLFPANAQHSAYNGVTDDASILPLHTGDQTRFWSLFLFFLSYRQAMQVTEGVICSSLQGETVYYRCPRCRVTVEREFMAYCDRCGQRLNWDDYESAQLMYAGQQESVHT